MAAGISGCTLVHSHTWYANLAGHLAKLLYDVPHVVTSHSLEPQRPWKAEQLGGGYRLSSWAERTAYESADAIIAVSAASRVDVLASYPALDPARVHVVHNGIDADFFRPVEETDVVERFGVDLSRPYVVFVGRITRQKGVPHLLRAGLAFDPRAQIVLVAGAADTPELAAETDAAVAELHARRDGVFLVSRDAVPGGRAPGPRPRRRVRLPVGLRATRHRQPGGDGVAERPSSPATSAASPRSSTTASPGCSSTTTRRTPSFEAGLAKAVNELLGDPDRAVAMGAAGRERAIARFGWDVAARRTLEIYEELVPALSDYYLLTHIPSTSPRSPPSILPPPPLLLSPPPTFCFDPSLRPPSVARLSPSATRAS